MSNDATPDLSSLLFTRASLALARTERLVQTWLPPPTPEELARKANAQEQDRNLFAPEPEL